MWPFMGMPTSRRLWRFAETPSSSWIITPEYRPAADLDQLLSLPPRCEAPGAAISPSGRSEERPPRAILRGQERRTGANLACSRITIVPGRWAPSGALFVFRLRAAP